MSIYRFDTGESLIAGLNHSLLCALAVLILIAPRCASARNRAAEKLRGEARAAEVEGKYDEALRLAKQALFLDPSDPAYALEVHRIRFEDGAMHIKAGYKLRALGQPARALAEFLKANETDPASDLAEQEIRITREMIGGKSPADPGATRTPAEAARDASDKRTDRLSPVPELRPLNTELLDLKMMNKPRILFETVCKIAGVNVIFDPDYNNQQTIASQQFDIARTTLDQALDQLAVATRSFWKPLSANTVFVTVDNPTKRREYAEQVVKVFYLSNATGAQEMQEILTVVRTVVDVAKVFNYTAQNAIVVRAESDTMALVEKLIANLDKPRSEVVVDVMVMEVSSTWTRALSTAVAGTGLSTGVSFAPRPGITTPVSSSTTSSSSSSSGSSSSSSSSTSVPVSNIGHFSSADFSITSLPGATLEAVLSDSGTRVLQQPQLRAVDNTKAVLKIGDKVPTASGSYSAGTGATAVSALVNTQFTYLDVGVNLEITPKVHSREEVSLHLDLDVSQVKAEIDLGGINEPEISQNKMSADVRLREGEVSLIGGIIQQTDSKGITGIPGLTNLPILGRLFSSENLEKDRTELVIALIPHIVRAPSITESDLKGVASGNATQIKVNYIPASSASGNQSPGVLTAPPATAPPDAGKSTNSPRVAFTPSNVDAQLGSEVTVTLYGDDISNLASIAAHLQFDPHLLRISNLVASDLLKQGGPQIRSTENILNDSGQADFLFSRDSGTGTVSGSGGLVSIVFQAVGRGDATVTVSSLSVAASPPPLRLTIR